MNSPDPILTIAMPCYNVERYLKRGLDSLNDSRFKSRLEVLIIDDGSTDTTSQIASSYASVNPEIFKLIQKSNGGHGSAINTGIEHASGQYFRIVDGDDWVSTDDLTALLDVLDSSRADLVIDRRADVDMGSMQETQIEFIDKVQLDISIPFESVIDDMEILDLITIHNTSVRTSLLRDNEVALLEKTFYVDYEYIAKVLLCASTIEFVDLSTYRYLIGNSEQSVADDNYVRRFDDHTRVTEELLRLFSSEEDDLTDPQKEFLRHRIDLIINTHIKIALIFDKDRKRGSSRGKHFMDHLSDSYPDFAKRAKRRYSQSRVLHFLGVDSQEKLDRITSIRS